MEKIICGDSLEVLKTLESESADCVITSPPYFGLRDYGEAGQIGLEDTPQEYVAKLVEVFREVRRVLKKEGTLWLNLGDSYAGSGKGQTREGSKDKKRGKIDGMKLKNSSKGFAGIKPKDLIGIPWRVAFALQTDGWYLRQDIIWYKPNPMPESVTDRCTKSHEYIFLLTKSPRYFYDADAIKERAVRDLDGNGTIKRAERQKEGLKSNPDEWKNGIRHKNLQEKGQEPHTMHKLRITYPNGKHKDGQQSPKMVNGYRNKRSVWTITTKGFPEAHFATFPYDLVEPMILAGCPKGGTVLDCFSGAATTGVVAKGFGRNYIGIELNPEYVAMSESRLSRITPPML